LEQEWGCCWTSASLSGMVQHHSEAFQSVVIVWDLNCMLHIPEYEGTGFKIVVVEKL